MFRIGEFSRLSRVTIKALRYYDRLGLLQPAHVDPFTGYRFYTAAQLPRLNRILALKDLGFSLDQIAALLDEGLTPEQLRGMLRLRRAEIEAELAEGLTRLARVEARLRLIEQEGAMPEFDIVIKQVEPLRVVALRDVLPGYDQVGRFIGELFQRMSQQHLTPAGPPFATYHDEEFREQDVDVEVSFPVAASPSGQGDLSLRELPGGPVAALVYRGAFDGIGAAYVALLGWIEANGYRVAGPNREIYLQGPGMEPSDFVTEIQFPVEKT